MTTQRRFVLFTWLVLGAAAVAAFIWAVRGDRERILGWYAVSSGLFICFYVFFIGGQWWLEMISFAAFTTLVSHMGDASMAASQVFVALLSISRNLERVADLATNIAEDVVYMIKGEDIRHIEVD